MTSSGRRVGLFVGSRDRRACPACGRGVAGTLAECANCGFDFRLGAIPPRLSVGYPGAEAASTSYWMRIAGVQHPTTPIRARARVEPAVDQPSRPRPRPRPRPTPGPRS